MARVFYKISGGAVQEANATTIGELKRLVNKTDFMAKVSNDIADDQYELSDDEVVFLAENKVGA